MIAGLRIVPRGNDSFQRRFCLIEGGDHQLEQTVERDHHLVLRATEKAAAKHGRVGELQFDAVAFQYLSDGLQGGAAAEETAQGLRAKTIGLIDCMPE